jgi:hypothetical protein
MGGCLNAAVAAVAAPRGVGVNSAEVALEVAVSCAELSGRGDKGSLVTLEDLVGMASEWTVVFLALSGSVVPPEFPVVSHLFPN